jgi:hypothetical protein
MMNGLRRNGRSIGVTGAGIIKFSTFFVGCFELKFAVKVCKGKSSSQRSQSIGQLKCKTEQAVFNYRDLTFIFSSGKMTKVVTCASLLKDYS